MLVTALLTFGASIVPVATSPTFVRDLQIEPLRTNANICYVGDSTLVQDGSAGVVRSLAVPPASNGILDRYQRGSRGAELGFDAGQLYVGGTAGQKMVVSYWSI